MDAGAVINGSFGVLTNWSHAQIGTASVDRVRFPSGDGTGVTDFATYAIPISGFSSDSVPVGTGSGAFQQETGFQFRTSMGVAGLADENTFTGDTNVFSGPRNLWGTISSELAIPRRLRFSLMTTGYPQT